MTTREKLVAVAVALLDAGGEKAVTLRAVGHGAGLSHNAPYKHFANRDALLSAVATSDFEMLGAAFRWSRLSSDTPRAKLIAALDAVIAFSHEHPMRYRLLFGDASVAAGEGEFERSGLSAFSEMVAIVHECQTTNDLPAINTATMAGLVFATVHGLLSFEAIGQMRAEKGFIGVGPSVDLLLQMLSPRKASALIQ